MTLIAANIALALRRMQPALGTYVEVAACGSAASRAIAAGFAAVRRAEALWSFQDPASELSRLNRSAGRRVPLSRPTLRLLRLAWAMMRASGGAFDPTLGGALVAQGVLPDPGGPSRLPRGRADDLVLDATGGTLRRPVCIVLDGIAKGHAVDLAVAAMRQAGASAGWVNAGGDLRAFGEVTVPVCRRAPGGGYVLLGGLRGLAIATSDVPAEPRRARAAFPARILGTADGRAPEPGGWTVLARTAWRADALTKVAACVPAERRAAVLRRLGGRLAAAAG